MDIRIGIINSPRELSFESDQTAAEIEKIVTSALEGDAKFMRLLDDKGRVFVIAVDTFAYIEVGSETSRRVGFVA